MHNETHGESNLLVRLQDVSHSARPFVLAAGLLVAASATACARQVVQIPQAIGPNPSPASVVDTGRLIVYTEERRAPDDENQSSLHRPYLVLDGSQKVALEVDNFTGADVIALPAGHYTVRVDADQRRTVSVPVRIVTGRTTEVHLDGKWRPERANTAALIQGPDGSLLGFRADLSANSANIP
jgi:hypothetical protein